MEKIKEVVLSVQTLLGSQSEVLLFSGQTNNFTEIVSGKSAPRSMKGEPTGLFPSCVWKQRKFIFYATLKILCALIYPKHITTIFFTDFFFFFFALVSLSDPYSLLRHQSWLFSAFWWGITEWTSPYLVFSKSLHQGQSSKQIIKYWYVHGGTLVLFQSSY